MIRTLTLTGIAVRFALSIAAIYACVALALLAITPNAAGLAIMAGVFGLTNLTAAAQEAKA